MGVDKLIPDRVQVRFDLLQFASGLFSILFILTCAPYSYLHEFAKSIHLSLRDCFDCQVSLFISVIFSLNILINYPCLHMSVWFDDDISKTM